MSASRHLACAIALAAATRAAHAQPVLMLSPDAFAKRSLSTVRQLADARTFRDMGFQSLAEVASPNLDVGARIEVFVVRNADLAKFPPGADASSLLQPTGVLVYPVVLQGVVKCSLSIKHEAGKWKLVRVGDPGNAKLVTTARASKPQPDSWFSVGVPSLGLEFIGRMHGGRLVVAPIENVRGAGWGWDAGQVVDGADAFTKLRPYAAGHDGFPR